MSETQPLHVPLDKPPLAISLTVRALLARVQSGGLRVPPFQRPLRWQADDVVKLFDSLWRGYPMGSLLFWKHAAPEDNSYQLGEVNLPVSAHPDAWWIVDGQQRVTALAAALLDLGPKLKPTWVVRFDPRSGAFLSGPVPPQDAGQVVPLSVLGDLRRLGRWLRESTLDENMQTQVEEAQQRLLDYNLSAYVMETEHPAALQGVFARLNSTGVRMRSDEVFQALLGAGLKETPGVMPGRAGLDLNELQRACDLDAFGQPPRSEILKAVLAMSGQDPTQRLEYMNEQAVGRLVNAQEAEEALRRTVAFLQSPPTAEEPGCGIPCYAFIPYPAVFVLLSRWFYVFPDSGPLVRRRLAQWLWRATLNATHERAAVSNFRLQVRLMKGQSAEDELDALSRVVGEPDRVAWELERFDARNAKSRVEMLALLSLTPRYRDGVVSWRALVSSGQRVAREILRPTKQVGPAQSLLGTAANRALLDTQHTGLKTEFFTWNPEKDRQALASHLISEETWQFLKDDRTGDFLQHRGAQVQALCCRFLTAQAALGSPRLAPVSRYTDLEPELPFDQDQAAAAAATDGRDEQTEADPDPARGSGAT